MNVCWFLAARSSGMPQGKVDRRAVGLQEELAGDELGSSLVGAGPFY